MVGIAVEACEHSLAESAELSYEFMKYPDNVEQLGLQYYRELITPAAQ